MYKKKSSIPDNIVKINGKTENLAHHYAVMFRYQRRYDDETGETYLTECSKFRTFKCLSLEKRC